MDVTTGYSFNLLKSYTPEMIQNLISNPMEYNEELRKLSRQLYNSNGVLTNVVDYSVSLPTLNKVVVGKGVDEKKNKRNVNLTEETLELIKDEEFIRDAIFSGAVDGTAFYYCEFSKPINDNTKFLSDYEIDSISEINSLDFNMSIISLPIDYCRIRGIKNSSYVVAFNLKFFDECGEKLENKLKKYPKEIRDGYYKYKESENGSSWLVLDNSRTIVHKIRSAKNEIWGRPIVLPAISDILYSDYFMETKQNTLHDINSSIFYQTFPEGKEKGTSALTSKQQSDQHSAVRDAIVNKNNKNSVSFLSVAAGTKLDKIKIDSDIFNEKNEATLRDDIATDLGFGASLLNASSSGNYSTQQNNLNLIFSQVFTWVTNIATELNKVINAHVVKDKKNPVKIVYLPTSLVNRAEFVGYMKDLYLSGHGSLSAYIASTGMNVDAYIAMMDKELDEKWDEKYLPHITSYTATENADKSNPPGNLGGRPQEDNPTNENTVQSKTNNDNSNPKPSTK